jgi:hypothetical protein
VLAALSATTLTLTVLAPAGWSRTPLGGPLDGVIPAAASRKRVVVLRCSQTQTFVLVVALRVSADLSLADALDRLRAAPDIVVDDVDFVFDGNAAVAEYFRDLGRPDGAFWETVIFGRTLDLDDGICTLVAACHPAAVLPDTARAIATGDGNSAASEPC